jgi:glycosyltransferase involved in cell wall biosynthesis
LNIVLVIEGTYPWYRGGVSEWVYQYLINSPDNNFTILQIATDTFIHLDPSEALYPIPDNVKGFYRIVPPELRHTWESDFSIWFAKNEREISIAMHAADIIHVTNTGFAGWLGYKMSVDSGLPLVLTEHALYWLEVQKGAVALECGYKIPPEHEKTVVELFKNIAQIVYSKADLTLSVSKCNIELQQSFGAENPVYLPNGIPASEIRDGKKDRVKTVIGWVGRCAEMKNPRKYFEYVDFAHEHNLDIDFIMLLSDAGEHELEQIIRDTSERYPQVKMIWNKNALPYFTEMDFLLITSHNESQPLVIFEALANNVIPTGNIVGDFDKDFGLAFDNHSIEQQLNKMIDLWDDRVRYIELLESKRELLKEEHTWETIFETYRNKFQTLLEDINPVNA